MEEEIESLRMNDMWDLVVLPNGRRTIGNKWVLKKKKSETSHVEKFKDRLVAKGYSQVQGLDFGDIFSPITILTSITLLMYLAVMFDLEIEKKDVNKTFIHGYLEEEIYMNQPEGFIMKGKEELVYRIKEYIYGLKQSHRMWYQKFDSYTQGLGFKKS